MISRKELFAEISNEAVTEDGEVVGYFVKNSRMNLLEQMLCSTVTVKMPKIKMLEDYLAEVAVEERKAILLGVRMELHRALNAEGIKWEAE